MKYWDIEKTKHMILYHLIATANEKIMQRNNAVNNYVRENGSIKIQRFRFSLRYSGNLGKFLTNKITQIFFSGESGIMTEYLHQIIIIVIS